MKPIWIALAVAACALAATWPSLSGGILSNMDDDVYMARAEQAGGLTTAGLRWAFTDTQPYYHPLPRLSYLATYQFCGTRPVGHHAVNVALHALNSALVVALAWTLFRSAATAALAGLLFAVHPLQAESVAWLSVRTQLFCVGLMLGCALSYARFAGTRSRWRWLPGALFLLGWLAKPIVATMPLVLLVLDWFPLRRHETVGWPKLVREKLWMLAVGAVLTPVTYLFAAQDAMVPRAGVLSWGARLLVAERAAVFYLWKLIWPAWLSPFYPLAGKITLASPEFFVPALVLVGLSALAWRYPVWRAAWLAYLALVLPVSGLTQFGTQSVANRHAYIAMVPLVFAIAGGAVWLYQRAPAAGRVGLIAAGLVVVAGLAGKTHATCRMWRDDETLWSNVLRWYPDYAYANWKIAIAEAVRQNFAAALPCAERAFAEYPDNPELRSLTGLVYVRTGHNVEAIRVLSPLVQTNLWFPAARFNLACAYARLGSNDAAAAVLNELITREPRFAEHAQRDRDLAPLLPGAKL